MLATRTADVGSIRLAAKPGFTEAERFRAWGGEQWLGLRFPVTPPAETPTAGPPGHAPGAVAA